MPDHAAVIAPPPAMFAVCVIAGAVTDHFVPLPIFTNAPALRYTLGVAVFALSIVIGGAAFRRFRAKREHPSPYKPTFAIVDTGIYRFTRNPIYVSFFVTAIAIGILANSWWIIGSIVPLFPLLHFGVVLREEQYLSAKFGAAYDDYRKRVRRWI